ncbi:hypothetical protein DFJ73DRAFT_806450 [Zopfochytrium polystomum]|nr:hypothetical protein DFJ73DRAFT_806450 [Zopfochytrium polystomum]
MNNLAQKEFYTIVAGAAILAANAGFINVVTLAGAFSVTVSHVTGNVSRIAMGVTQFDLTTLSTVTSILFSFMFGSFIAGYLVGDHKFQLGKAYGYGLLLESAMLFLSFLTLKRDLILGEWCAAFACGLQNALATSYSGMVVRTTHMTGIATDIGNILGQACRIDSHAELWRLRVHVPILIGFIFGGMLGQWSYLGMKENALLLPTFFIGGVGCAYLSLPYIQLAAETLRKAGDSNNGPKVEVRVVGDPRKVKLDSTSLQAAVSNHFARIEGRDVDLEIKQFYAEVDGSNDGISGRFSISGESKAAHGIIAGESTEEMLVVSSNNRS